MQAEAVEARLELETAEAMRREQAHEEAAQTVEAKKRRQAEGAEPRQVVNKQGITPAPSEEAQPTSVARQEIGQDIENTNTDTTASAVESRWIGVAVHLMMRGRMKSVEEELATQQREAFEKGRVCVPLPPRLGHQTSDEEPVQAKFDADDSREARLRRKEEALKAKRAAEEAARLEAEAAQAKRAAEEKASRKAEAAKAKRVAKEWMRREVQLEANDVKRPSQEQVRHGESAQSFSQEEYTNLLHAQKLVEEEKSRRSEMDALEFITNKLEDDPAFIYEPELDFFKEFLLGWGAEIPVPEKGAKDEEVIPRDADAAQETPGGFKEGEAYPEEELRAFVDVLWEEDEITEDDAAVLQALVAARHPSLSSAFHRYVSTQDGDAMIDELTAAIEAHCTSVVTAMVGGSAAVSGELGQVGSGARVNPPPALADGLFKLRINDLKALLCEQGVDFSGCAEKSELIELLQTASTRMGGHKPPRSEPPSCTPECSPPPPPPPSRPPPLPPLFVPPFLSAAALPCCRRVLCFAFGQGPCLTLGATNRALAALAVAAFSRNGALPGGIVEGRLPEILAQWEIAQALTELGTHVRATYSAELDGGDYLTTWDVLGKFVLHAPPQQDDPVVAIVAHPDHAWTCWALSTKRGYVGAVLDPQTVAGFSWESHGCSKDGYDAASAQPHTMSRDAFCPVEAMRQDWLLRSYPDLRKGVHGER